MLTITLYTPREGGRTHKADYDIEGVYPDDAAWFKQHCVKVSMEQVGNDYAVYGDIGRVTEGEPDEVLVLARGRSCQDTLSALRAECEKAMKETK